MQSEVINIVIYDEYYEVTVNFDFYNEGPDENVLIGFPVESWGYIDNEYVFDNIYDFKTYINGDLISEYIIRDEEYIDMYFLLKKKWYLREILFSGNKHTYSIVTYRVRNQYNFGGSSVGYIFGTGRNWKDKIGKMTVYITHDDNIIISRISNIDKFDFLWEENRKYKFEIENIEPEIGDKIYISIQQFDWFFDDDELNYTKKRLIYKDENDIQYFSINQIRLLINSYYLNKEHELNEVDIKNIHYLLKLENKIPRNSQEILIEYLPEVKMLELFKENQEIEYENILEINSYNISSELNKNNIEVKSISVRIILIIIGSCILTACILLFVIKNIKNSMNK